jgi:hypothetical protein
MKWFGVCLAVFCSPCGSAWPRELFAWRRKLFAWPRELFAWPRELIEKARELLIRGVLFSSDPCGLCAVSTSTECHMGTFLSSVELAMFDSVGMIPWLQLGSFV